MSASSLNFSDNDKFLLIDCVKARPKIWDAANKDYKTRNKNAEWEKVRKDMFDAAGRKFTVEFIKDQWGLLRRQFNNNKNKKKTGASGSGEAGLQPVWRFWTPMLFVECGNVRTDRLSELSVGNVKTDEGINYLKVDLESNKRITQQDTDNIDIDVEGDLEEDNNNYSSTSNPSTGKRPEEIDPKIQMIEYLLAKQREIDPLAIMVDQMLGRLADGRYRRTRFDFKNAIMGILRDTEACIMDIDEIEDI